MLAASDISEARLEWPPGRDEEVVGTGGANRTDSGSLARGEGSVVGGRDADDGLEEDDEEEVCRW